MMRPLYVVKSTWADGVVSYGPGAQPRDVSDPRTTAGFQDPDALQVVWTMGRVTARLHGMAVPDTCVVIEREKAIAEYLRVQAAKQEGV